MKGRIIAAFGRHYTVEDEQGELYHCYPRGKKSQACVGDWVEVTLEGKTQGVIERIIDRKNLLYRSDETKSKQFAANVDLILFVVATEPEFSLELVGRALVAAKNTNIALTILLNKADRVEKLAQAHQKLNELKKLGVNVIEISALDSSVTQQRLQPTLGNKVSLLLGQSGMGKSTILNALIPEAQAHTQAFSVALGTGKHTTTSTRLYHLPTDFAAQAMIIDSPGFQAFGLKHLSKDELAQGFPEFDQVSGDCKFYNCKHLHEPQCKILEAFKAGLIDADRYGLYVKLMAELDQGQRF